MAQFRSSRFRIPRSQLPAMPLPVDQWDRAHEIFAWLQWSPPKGSPCYESLYTNFPGAIPDQAMHDRIVAMLAEHGFNPTNTLFGTSICPDEINNEPGDIADIMKNHWGAVFPLGGISGAPFVGKTGFGAFSSHVPAHGNVFMFFGPHTAVSESGEVGKYF